jgi:hypothetical protein
MLFVLLGRDVAAPFAIRAWVDERLRLGKNMRGDAQIAEALACAETMETEGQQQLGLAAQSAGPAPEADEMEYPTEARMEA